MPSKIKEIEEEAFRLSSHERALLAEHLIHSLDEEEDIEAEKLWIEESKRRYQEYKRGKVKAKTAETVFKEARSKIECSLLYFSRKPNKKWWSQRSTMSPRHQG